MKLILSIYVALSCFPAWACSCRGHPSAKDAWRSSPVIFVGTVEQAVPNRIGDQAIAEQTVLIRAEEVFKGAKKDQVFRLEQAEDNCPPKFETGKRELFYLYSTEKPDVWEVPGCHRPHSLDRAQDDLHFLRGLPRSAEGSRLSGVAKLYQNGPQGFEFVRTIPGVRVKIASAMGPAITTTTNADGVYEWYGLPVAVYEVDIEVPKGMRIHFKIGTANATPPGERNWRRDSNSGTAYVGAQSGVSVDFILMADTRITGRVLDPNGNPMDGVLVGLQPVSSNGNVRTRMSSSTKSGKFKLEEMPPGQYYIVLNSDGRMSVREPFPRLYYPGTTDLKQAVAITVPEGGSVENIDIHVPKLQQSIELSGQVLFSDGMPVPEAYLRFSSRDETYSESVSVQADGSFRLRILEGIEGELKAGVYIGETDAKACPQFQATFPEESTITQLYSIPALVGKHPEITKFTLYMQVPSCKSWPRKP